MASASEIEELKATLRNALRNYRRMKDGREFDCGMNLSAYIHPELGLAARDVNEAAKALKAADPAFPSSWVPYPEGN